MSEPTLIVYCDFCNAEIHLYGDLFGRTDEAGFYEFGIDESAICECGATYGDGDLLETEVREIPPLDPVVLNRIHALFLQKLAAQEPNHPWLRGL